MWHRSDCNNQITWNAIRWFVGFHLKGHLMTLWNSWFDVYLQHTHISNHFLAMTHRTHMPWDLPRPTTGRTGHLKLLKHVWPNHTTLTNYTLSMTVPTFVNWGVVLGTSTFAVRADFLFIQTKWNFATSKCILQGSLHVGTHFLSMQSIIGVHAKQLGQWVHACVIAHGVCTL